MVTNTVKSSVLSCAYSSVAARALKAVRQMEKRGIQTNIGNLNREIKAANSLMKSIRQLIKNLKGWIIELLSLIHI